MIRCFNFELKVFALLAFILLAACHRQVGSESQLQTIDDSLVATDLSSKGSYSVNFSDYNYGEAAIDQKVYSVLKTDVRGRLYLPEGDSPAPLLVFLHGNHGTCGKVDATTGIRTNSSSHYTRYGTCPEGWVEAPSYAGYDYLAETLASYGFAVISINANRGITAGPGALIAERGRLVLKHLSLFNDWNKTGAPQGVMELDVAGRLDFSHVGLMGHSRGGEGVRAAYKMYRLQNPTSYAPAIKDMTIEAVLEIAPVDFQVNDIYDVEGANWSVIIGTCDGDVFDFQGVNTFERRRAKGLAHFSSVVYIPGANHNSFNTEWQIADTRCDRGDVEIEAEKQKELNRLLHTAFFRGFVGKSKVDQLQNVFDPQYRLPQQITDIYEIGRESIDANSKIQVLSNTQGHLVSLEDQMVQDRQVIKLAWDHIEGGTVPTFTSTLPENSADWEILSLAISPNQNMSCLENNEICEGLDFSMQLVYQDGGTSDTVQLIDYVNFSRYTYIYQAGADCEGIFAEFGYCLRPLELCDSLDGIKYNDPNDFPDLGVQCYVRQTSFTRTSPRNRLFREVPLELSDFGFKVGTSQPKITGIQFIFDKAQAGQFLLDYTVISRDKD